MSRSCTPCTMSGLMFFFSSLVILPLTASTRSKIWLATLSYYLTKLPCSIASSDSLVHQTWVPFSTHCPVTFFTQSTRFISAYIWHPFNKKSLHVSTMIFSSSLHHISTDLPLVTMFLINLTFSFAALHIVVISLFSLNSIFSMHSKIFLS